MSRKFLVKKVVSTFLCLGLLVSLLPAAAVAQTRPISIEFDGRTVPSEVAPVLVGTGARARTMVPLRVIFETLGADVSWDAATQTVTGRKAGTVISLVIGNPTATVNGSPRTLDQPAQIRDGRTLVPFRFVGEALGARVEWDSTRRVVRIASTDASVRRSPLERELRLTTGGASFPNPLYQRLVHEYARITDPTIRIDYASVGSGAGIRGILGGTFDFAGTDAPLTSEQQAQVRPNEILHIPTVMGAVAAVYNIPGVGTGLRLTGEVLADIYRGVISNWNDTRVAELNRGVSLPDQRITVVRRSDSSGTTFIFTDYLSKVSEAWRTGPGRGTTVSWPAAGNIGARGNEGVAAQVGQLPGAIGYVELSNAFLNRLNTVALRNSAGNFIVPSVEAATAAAAAVAAVPGGDPLTHPTNSPGTDAYPIVGLTWILVHRDQADAAKARAIVDFLRWAVVERNLEPFAADLFYAPLPQGTIDRVREQLQSINHNNTPIWR